MFQSTLRPLALSFTLLTGLSVPCPASALETLWTTEGFAQPESVLPDPDRNHLIVSNIDGDAGTADGKGFLSLLSMDGSILNLHWIDSLDAPKGMALVDGRLYVSDLTRLRVFDAGTGAQLDTFTHPDAQFLNDVTADARGRVYVSDMLGGRIFRLEGDHFMPWLSDRRIPYPNGLLVEGDSLIIGSWGVGLRKDFTTDHPGGLFRVPLTGGTLSPLPETKETANVDGITRLGDHLVFSDWVTGAVFTWKDGHLRPLGTTAPGLADIGALGDQLFLPHMFEGTVSAVR
jgi:hypothetical protein